ncbi:exopolysaccharide biosynthesis protein [Thalassococcus sp. BH17M4-6]|uniref:exopolysaccharide biosynthesis protein n=1 Tax=Thalassococcus sp. BH17M4-6 TaxID=3413148 RepID=UPI003BBF8D4A
MKPDNSSAPDGAPVDLTHLIGTLLPGDGDARVSVRDVLSRIGDQSFAPAILVPALVLVSPISAIPGMPTIGGLIIMLITIQKLLHRDHLWLPDVLMRRSVTADRMRQAHDFLIRPARWVDRHSRGRLRPLTIKPMRFLATLAIFLTALTWPFLEILPMFTSVSALAVSLLTVGLLTRDGAFMAAGYTVIGGIVLFFAMIWQGLV